MDDESHMRVALDEACLAAADGEVPIGAVVVCDGAVVARAHNRRENDRDPTAHAELLAIRAAARSLGRWRLSGCTVYVTLEPCPMCAGAMHQARVDRLVFGALDPKAGAVGSLYDLSDDRRLNHRFDVTSGVLEDESSALLKAFFARLRRDGGDFGRGEE
jgi:tRNA(adenine34) deaminase